MRVSLQNVYISKSIVSVALRGELCPSSTSTQTPLRLARTQANDSDKRVLGSQ